MSKENAKVKQLG